MNYQLLSAEELLNHQEHFIDFAKNDIEYFKFIPAKLRNQKVFVLNFIRYFETYEYDPDNPAIYSDTYIAAYCSEILSSSLVLNNDREVVMKLAEKNMACLYNASDDLKDDTEIAVLAIKGHMKDHFNGAHFSHYAFNVFSNRLREKLSNVDSYAAAINLLESELLYKELSANLNNNNLEKKKVKL